MAKEWTAGFEGYGEIVLPTPATVKSYWLLEIVQLHSP
jgi:hypothetical protein